MKKRVIILFAVILSPLLLGSEPGSKFTISRLNMQSMPFNERRDPSSDSPFNAFDGDIKTSALYSDFTLEFSEPQIMNEIRIINGTAANKFLYKKYNRLRDIEITLYTLNPELKSTDLKSKKQTSKKAKTGIKNSPHNKPEPEVNKTDKKKTTPDNEKKINNKTVLNIVPYPDYKLYFTALQDDEKKYAQNTGVIKTDTQSDNKEQSIKQDKTEIKSGSDTKTIQASDKKLKNKPSSDTKVKPDLKNKIIKSEPGNKIKNDNDKQKIDIRDTGNTKIKKTSISETKEKSKPDNVIQKNNSTSELKTETAKSVNVKTAKKINKPATKKSGKELTVKKMSGMIRPVNDRENRIFIYYTLKDITATQKIRLKKKFTVKKIGFRTRDNGFYTGVEHDRTTITEIGFYNNGKRVQIDGIDEMKKNYTEKYSNILLHSIDNKLFLLYNQNEVIMRMKFLNNGKIEYIDRYKCKTVKDNDCSLSLFPERWRIRDGKLYMRFRETWMLWKYELDSETDILDPVIRQPDSSRYLKLYYKTDNGFSEEYIYLMKSEEDVWK